MRKSAHNEIPCIRTPELARLCKAFASISAMKSIALKAAVVLPTLLQQKPTPSQSQGTQGLSGQTVEHVARREFAIAVLEGRTIQQRIPKSQPQDSQKRLARSFANLRLRDTVESAIIHDKIHFNTKQVCCAHMLAFYLTAAQISRLLKLESRYVQTSS